MSRIVVADDAALVREMVGEVLRADGHDVIEACDGNEAVRLVEETSPDLLLVDLQMPGMNGFGVLEKIRRSGSMPVRVVAFTAHAMAGDHEKAVAAGFDGYIVKPIGAARLRERVKELLAS